MSDRRGPGKLNGTGEVKASEGRRRLALMSRFEQENKMKIANDVPMALLLLGVLLPGCAQYNQPATPPAAPLAASTSPQEQLATAERQFQVVQDAHQRLMRARTAQERQALMAEHSRAMRNAMAAMQAMHGPGMRRGPGMPGRHMQQQMDMMHMMMGMMMDRIDMLSPPAK